jgi:proline iminopeptidase
VSAPEEGYVLSPDGEQLFYRVVGTGVDAEQDPIVVVHGGPGGGGTMNSLLPDLEPLAARHRMIYYDQRGGGRSSLPDDPAALDARWFVEDLEAIRRHFDLDRLVILTNSFGPVLVARYAEAYPERLGRLIFMGAIGPRRADVDAFQGERASRMDPKTRERSAALVQELLAGTSEDPLAACHEYVALSGGPSTSADAPVSRAIPCDGSPEAIRYTYSQTAPITFASFGEWDFTGSLQSVSAPLLVVYGDQDPSPRSTAEAWVRAVPNARLLVIPGAGHGPHIDAPDAFFAAVETFLGEDWPEGSRTVQ